MGLRYSIHLVQTRYVANELTGVGREAGEEQEGQEEQGGDLQGQRLVGDDGAQHEAEHGGVGGNDHGASDW